MTLHVLANPYLCAVLFAVAATRSRAITTNELAAAVAEDVSRSVCPGGVDGSPFWNRRSISFMHPPAFDFAEVPGASSYRFTVTDDMVHVHEFTANRPTADLSPVWKKVPIGFVRVEARGVDGKGMDLGLAGTRRFWKSAPYEPGVYPSKPWSYLECVRRWYPALMAHPNTRHFLKHGTPDGKTDLLNIYPAKMNAALITGMLRYAKVPGAPKEDAIKVAMNAGDYMISISQPDGAPLAGFPPTYWKMEGQKSNFASIKYAGQNMLVYPASMGAAYILLHSETGEMRYLDAALKIARTYEKLQLADGTWYLKVWEKDARAVIEGNGSVPVKLIPIGVCSFMERLARHTGDDRWRKVGDKAFAYLDAGPLKTLDFAPQFEDTTPSANYRDLASVSFNQMALYLLRRFPDDPKRRKQARELVRLMEDQFACWRKPCRADGTGIVSEPEHGFNPVWNPVCNMDDNPHGNWSERFDNWIDVPGIVEKYRWYVMINGTTALAMRAYLALYRAEGDELSLAKAKTLGDSMVRVQEMDGGAEIATHWVVSDLTGISCPNNWTNCGLGAVLALQELAEVVEAVPRRQTGDRPR